MSLALAGAKVRIKRKRKKDYTKGGSLFLYFIYIFFLKILSILLRLLQVGLVDLDICGPSIPKLLAVEGQPVVNSEYGWVPIKYA